MSGKPEASGLVDRIGGNSLALFFSYSLNTLLAGVVSIFLVRYLGREEYGLLSTTYAYISFFLLFTSVGLDTVVQRDAARDPEQARSVVEAVLGLRILLSVGAMILSWMMVFLIDPTPRLTWLVILVSFSFLFSAHSLFLTPYLVELRMWRPKLVMGGWSVVLSAAKLLFIALGAPLELFVGMEVVAGAGTFLLARMLAARIGFRPRLRFAPGLWARYLREAVPIAMAQTLIQVYLRVDHLMLYRLVGPEEVGLYGAATRLVELANVLPVVFMGSIFPILSRLDGESPGKLKEATLLSFRGMAWIGLPCGVFLFLFSQPILVFLFGGAFSAAAPMLRFLSWSVPLAFLNSVFFNRLFTSGDQATAARTALGAALLNVILNAILIPRYQGHGAALASLISYGMVIVFGIGFRGSRGISVLAIRALPRPALGAGMVLALLSWAGVRWMWGLFLVPVLFALSMVLLKEWNREEISWFRRIFRRSG